MKPVLVLQHLASDGPGYLATWLQRQGLALDLRNTEAGDAFPADLQGHGALAILGGEMSANDPLPSLRQAEALVRQAVQTGVPAIGHCLGGQLMARALGAAVAASPQPEVGWHPVTVLGNPTARDWFGAPGPHTAFQWHFEAFSLPPGATPLASSPACPHQAFAIGPHLAMQFHVEADAEKLSRWVQDGAEDLREQCASYPTVHSAEAIHQGMTCHLAAQHRLADRLYARWLGLTFA